ncbi:MAG: glycoside hydrolase family 5 protein [Lachnospiraceae bacterium]|nr:glycoside hydrolase family 5 protein [Lachnospiraceae bacterium]
MRKKYCGFALIMAAVMALSGCAGNTANPDGAVEENADVNESGNAAGNDAGTNSETDTNLSAGEENSEGESNGLQTPVIEIEQKELPDSEALVFVRNMKTGWNLGNTFDASDNGSSGNDLKYESMWCGTVTTKEMIDALKEAGFQTIRIPVSWHNHLTDDNHTISEVWLSRVQEVVDYAIDDGMYVIINIHHDFSTDYIYPTSEYLEQSKTYVTDIWTQVADRFKDYDDHLIMESMNEPRMVGSNNEWWLDFQNAECIDSIQCINEINQVFVDVVRSSGGNNATRYLMVPGYDASLQGAVNSYFSLPTDIEENQNKILVSVHAYTPYSFALQGEGESGSTDAFDMTSSSSTKDIDDLMKQLYDTFVKNGTGVVIGEYGARDKSGNLQARIDFTAYYIETARASGITCCVWDNNSFSGSGENFGLFRRQNMSFLYPEIVESIMAHCE